MLLISLNRSVLTKVNFSNARASCQYYFSKEIRQELSANLELISNARAAVVYPEGARWFILVVLSLTETTTRTTYLFLRIHSDRNSTADLVV